VTNRFLDIIDKNASRLTLLIDDLLLLARLDSGRLELNFQPVALHGAAQEALDDASLLAHARGIAVRNQIGDDVVALADPDRLRQVLANLIDNAIKYGRAEGTVIVTGRVLDAHYIEVGVHDDGPGIPEEAKARIFERFYRVDKARAREQGGTGLGLAIVKNVVEAHGGDIRVESGAGKGTTFHFTLRRPQIPRI
jgi:two-component system phosphate regulon sensor histidine kinase PhoR